LVIVRSRHVASKPHEGSNTPLLESNRAPTGGLYDGRG
jgi:hypothetical protein